MASYYHGPTRGFVAGEPGEVLRNLDLSKIQLSTSQIRQIIAWVLEEPSATLAAEKLRQLAARKLVEPVYVAALLHEFLSRSAPTPVAEWLVKHVTFGPEAREMLINPPAELNAESKLWILQNVKLSKPEQMAVFKDAACALDYELSPLMRALHARGGYVITWKDQPLLFLYLGKRDILPPYTVENRKIADDAEYDLRLFAYTLRLALARYPNDRSILEAIASCRNISWSLALQLAVEHARLGLARPRYPLYPSRVTYY
jgi:hypothetical protein